MGTGLHEKNASIVDISFFSTKNIDIFGWF